MIVVRDIEQRSDEWFQLRAGVITATGFSIARSKDGGRGKYKYQCKKALERVTGRYIDDQSFVSWQMRQGIEREPEALCAYEMLYGDIDTVGFVFLDERKTIGASPDGLGSDRGLEIKCPEYHTHLDYILGNKDPTKEYKAQIQGALWVSGLPVWHLASYCPHMPCETLALRVWEVERDDDYILEMEQSVLALDEKIEDSVIQIELLIEKGLKG